MPSPPTDPDASEEGAPVGPSEGEEAAFLAEQRAAEPFAPPSVAAPAAPAEPDAPLPALDDLVARIPAPTRELLGELFRARFVTVRRVPASALKD